MLRLHGLECTCCSESFIRSAHPLVSDIVLSMISLDYNDLSMAAAGHQAEAILEEIRTSHKGRYLLAVEGNAPLAQDGMSCFVAGRPFVDQLREMAADAQAVIAWGSCASNGCVQAARPNPTEATPVHKLVHDKPIINVPGCPPIAEVMTGVLTYMLTFERIPPLDRRGRPLMFYGQRIHDKCYRRPHFDAGQFVDSWDDEGARRGYCLYKMGCKGPTTYNACSTVDWNDGVSFPIQSGHGCIGCSEEGFWDKNGFYQHVTDEDALGIEIPENANTIRNIMQLTLQAQDHLVHFYHLHALDWVDVVSALSADPKVTSTLAQSISDWPKSSPGYFRDIQDRLERFVASGQLGPFARRHRAQLRTRAQHQG